MRIGKLRDSLGCDATRRRYLLGVRDSVDFKVASDGGEPLYSGSRVKAVRRFGRRVRVGYDVIVQVEATRPRFSRFKKSAR
jgi:hypothetical protein